MEVVSKFLYIYDYIAPIIDILALTFILYKAYEFMEKTNSMQIVKSAIIVLIAYAVASFLRLKTLIWIFRLVAPGLVIAFAVIFQPEIRKLFLRIGQNQWFAFGSRSRDTYIDSVLTAAEMLSLQKRGMLVAFLRHTKLENIIQTGTKLNSDLSSGLLILEFFIKK